MQNSVPELDNGSLEYTQSSNNMEKSTPVIWKVYPYDFCLGPPFGANHSEPFGDEEDQVLPFGILVFFLFYFNIFY